MLFTHAPECGFNGRLLTFCRQGLSAGNNGQPAMLAPAIGRIGRGAGRLGLIEYVGGGMTLARTPA